MTDAHETFERWKHDLKNQLGIVLGFSELLLHDMPVDDPRRPDIAEICAAAERAMHLVNGQMPRGPAAS